jgi:hypothetical protein
VHGGIVPLSSGIRNRRVRCDFAGLAPVERVAALVVAEIADLDDGSAAARALAVNHTDVLLRAFSDVELVVRVPEEKAEQAS